MGVRSNSRLTHVINQIIIYVMYPVVGEPRSDSHARLARAHRAALVLIFVQWLPWGCPGHQASLSPMRSMTGRCEAGGIDGKA